MCIRDSPGCPPRPEAIFDAVIKLRKKVSNESVFERNRSEQTHRYFTVEHNMNLVFSENTGEYLKKQTEKALDSSKNKEVFDSSKEDIKESSFNQKEM